MNIEMKLTSTLYQSILADLRRPHPFAFERVGFCSVRQSLTENGVLLLAERYLPVADDHYIYDSTVGAKIGEPALTKAMHLAYYGRDIGTGVFHIHLHDHTGPTGMSQEDLSSIPNVIDGLRQVNAKAPHGLIIFSEDHAHAQTAIADNDDDNLKQVAVVSVIGPRLLTFRHRRSHD
jgi:hypothetical protein